MRRLYISIIFTVLGSLFFIGWGLDKISELTESNTNISQDAPTTQLYRQLIEGLSVELNALPKDKLNERVSAFQQQYKINTLIEPSNTIALPSSVIKALGQQGGLLLATDNQQYLLRKLTQHPEFLLQLDLPIEQEQDNSFNFMLTLILYSSICGILILWLLPLTRRL